ncbi:MAG: PDZ domain-containing protein [Myxococcales bacterium]|nr:MAG: PDZ domain-containing protein [Myxococcales bacterium]
MSPTSPAAGQLVPGDVIVEIDKEPIRNLADAMKRTENVAPGKVMLLKVRRGNDTRFVAIKIK